jgi:predicted metal-dependent phosphotriesterase family hydrolase
VPKLRAAGVPDRAIHTILVENPRRLLSFQPKSA